MKSKIKYSKDEKISWVFRYLVHILHPVVIGSHLKVCPTSWGGVRRKYAVTYLDCLCDFENIPEEIPFPFKGVAVRITRKSIMIIGKDFYYNFSPHFLLTLQERFNTATDGN